MDIVRLIKISSQFPNTRLAKATRNYLLSLVEKEVDHNSRIARLTDRVASTPSNHWQKGLMLLKMASQGDDVDRLLEHWEGRSYQSLAFEGDKGELIRLAYENPSLRPLVLKKAIDVQETKQRGKDLKRTQNRAPKGEGKKTQVLMDKADKKKTEKQELQMLINQYDNASPAMKTKITNRMKAIIRGGKSTRQSPKLRSKLDKWEEIENGTGSQRFTSPTTGKKVKWQSLYSAKNGTPAKELALDIKKTMFIDPLFALAERIIKQKGGGKPKDESKGEDKGKEDTSTTDTSKSDSGGEDKGIVESLMESEGISKEEAQEMAGNILGDEGEEEEETTEAPDSSESATGQSVSTSGGLGSLGGGESSGGVGGGGGAKGYTPVGGGSKSKSKKKSKRKMQTQSRRKNRKKKGSELEG